MPKADPDAHFDAEAIVDAVHQQDIGLRVTTNNPERFRQMIYKAANRIGRRVHIYCYPRRPNSFAIVKKALGDQHGH
jgi:hypothetical protein